MTGRLPNNSKIHSFYSKLLNLNLTQAYVDYNSGTLPDTRDITKQKHTEIAPQVLLHTINIFESRDTNSGKSDLNSLENEYGPKLVDNPNETTQNLETELLVPLEELYMNETSEMDPHANFSN